MKSAATLLTASSYFLAMGSSCSIICGSTVSFILFWGLGCFTATDLLAGFLGVASDGLCRRKEFRKRA